MQIRDNRLGMSVPCAYTQWARDREKSISTGLKSFARCSISPPTSLRASAERKPTAPQPTQSGGFRPSNARIDTGRLTAHHRKAPDLDHDELQSSVHRRRPPRLRGRGELPCFSFRSRDSDPRGLEGGSTAAPPARR